MASKATPKLKCKKHPRYQGLGKPTSGCQTCKRIFSALGLEHQEIVKTSIAADKLKGKVASLNMRNRALVKEVIQMQSLLEFRQRLKKEFTSQIFAKKKTEEHDSEACAIMGISDGHIGEVVDPETINGFNFYNIAEGTARLETAFINGLSLVEMSQTRVRINHLVLALLALRAHPLILSIAASVLSRYNAMHGYGFS